MINLKNNERNEILLVKLNHILLKVGDNILELSQRRIGIAKEEIKERKLKIKIQEVNNELQVESDGKKEHEKLDGTSVNE